MPRPAAASATICCAGCGVGGCTMDRPRPDAPLLHVTGRWDDHGAALLCSPWA
jgi:hypothetical protein